MRLLIPLLFLALAALPVAAEAKPLHGPPECVRLYVGVAQADGVPSTFVGQKVRWACTGR
jgi:hypothetical protein